MGFILIFTWPVFNRTFRALVMIQLIISMPFWYLMTLHMKYEDIKKQELNTMRKELQQEKAQKMTF